MRSRLVGDDRQLVGELGELATDEAADVTQLLLA